MFVALALQAGAFIVSHSNTFDEPMYISAGVAAVKTGSLALESEYQPPLQKYLMGAFVSLLSPTLNTASPDFLANRPLRFGREFLYENSVKPELILAMGRLPSLLLSLLLAALVYLWARRWFGDTGGLLALGAYAFEPTVISNSAIASMDMGVTTFLFLSMYALTLFLEEGHRKHLVMSGVAAGLAMGTKLSGVFFFFWAAALIGWAWTQKSPWVNGKKLAGIVFGLTGAAAITLLVIYQVRFVGMFIDLVGGMVSVVFGHHPIQEYPNFLHGHLRVGGWWHYFLTAFLVKTPLPFLIAAGLAAVVVPRARKIPLLALVISFGLICTFAQKQNGLRYLLPVYPLLCVLIGGLAGTVGGPRWRIGLGTTLIAWSAIEMAIIAPNYLTYFNQLAGGPSNGYRWLVDCNLDWGQDFPAIRTFLEKEGQPDVILALFGNGNRDHYFGPHQDLIFDANNPEHFSPHINPLLPKREFLLVSATLYQGFGLSDPHVFDWLKTKMPYALIANSTFVFDVTNDRQSQFHIGEIYHRNGQKAWADRQLLRANALR